MLTTLNTQNYIQTHSNSSFLLLLYYFFYFILFQFYFLLFQFQAKNIEIRFIKDIYKLFGTCVLLRGLLFVNCKRVELSSLSSSINNIIIIICSSHLIMSIRLLFADFTSFTLIYLRFNDFSFQLNEIPQN